MKPTRFLCSVSLCGALSGCGLYYSTVTVNNRSQFALEEIMIYDGNRRETLPHIPATSSDTIWVHFPGEGGSKITFTIQGRRVERELCYHSTSNAFEATVTVANQGVEVRCS